MAHRRFRRRGPSRNWVFRHPRPSLFQRAYPHVSIRQPIDRRLRQCLGRIILVVGPDAFAIFISGLSAALLTLRLLCLGAY